MQGYPPSRPYTSSSSRSRMSRIQQITVCSCRDMNCNTFASKKRRSSFACIRAFLSRQSRSGSKSHLRSYLSEIEPAVLAVRLFGFFERQTNFLAIVFRSTPPTSKRNKRRYFYYVVVELNVFPQGKSQGSVQIL